MAPGPVSRFTILSLCCFLVVLIACSQQAPAVTVAPPMTTAEVQTGATPVLDPSPAFLPMPATTPIVATSATAYAQPTAEFTPTVVATETSTPNQKHTPIATPEPPPPADGEATDTPVPTTPTPEPTATPVPVVNLVLDAETSVKGYWSEGSADVTLGFVLSNEGDLPHTTVQVVKLSCLEALETLSGCDEEVSLALEDGFGPASGSFNLRMPTGVYRVALGYGSEEPLIVGVEVPPRILGVERDLFECYADREHAGDPRDSFLYGCGGWDQRAVEKWLNDVPIKVWAVGDPLYIESFREVLEYLSPILDLNFIWVASEQEADLRGYVGVHREDIDHLGFAPGLVDYGGFADASTVGGEAVSGYVVVWDHDWYHDENPPTEVMLHEVVHALLLNSHSTRALSIVGGSNMALLSPRDEALFRLHYHPLVRPGMTVQEVEELIVFRDQLLDAPAPEPIADPLRMVWEALVSLDEAGTASYNLRGGYIDRRCGQTFGIRRGPLEFKIGQFRLWGDDPALLHFHDHRNEFYIHYSLTDEAWKSHTRLLGGGEWKAVDLTSLTNWWIWNGKLHRTLRSILRDASPGDIAVSTADDGNIELRVTIDDSYTHMYLWGDGWRVESVDFTLELNPETFAIEGYRWLLRDRPPANDPDYPCLTYEEVATEFRLGVELQLPQEIPE